MSRLNSIRAHLDCFTKLAEEIVLLGARKATKYFSTTSMVRATRRKFKGKNPGRTEILFTIGQPNYKERLFIKRVIASGETFPIKHIRVKFDKLLVPRAKAWVTRLIS